MTTTASDGSDSRHDPASHSRVAQAGERAENITRVQRAMEIDMKRIEEDMARLQKEVDRVELECKPKRFVRNRKTRVVHRVLASYDEVGSGAITCCGWRFAHSPIVMCGEVPAVRREVCDTCTPALRAGLE